MNIGYIIDEGFAMPAGVSIYSLLYNNKDLKYLNIYILDDGISEESKEKLKTISNEFHRNIYFIDVFQIKSKLTNITKYNWNGSYSTYIRLMQNSIFPEMNEKMIMIDADTIINGSIKGLEEIDLMGNPCAMTLEAMPISYYFNSKLGYSELINGGLLVIDLEKWRECDAETRIIDFLLNVRSKNMLTDEDVISSVFKGSITRLSPNYNFLTQYYLYSNKFYYKFFGWNKLNKRNAFYSLEEIVNAKNNILIYHCIDSFTNRPWEYNNIHPYNNIFNNYLQLTPWKIDDKKVRKMSFRRSLEYGLRKYLPKPLSLLFNAIAVSIFYGIGAKKYYS